MCDSDAENKLIAKHLISGRGVLGHGVSNGRHSPSSHLIW